MYRKFCRAFALSGPILASAAFSSGCMLDWPSYPAESQTPATLAPSVLPSTPAPAPAPIGVGLAADVAEARMSPAVVSGCAVDNGGCGARTCSDTPFGVVCSECGAPGAAAAAEGCAPGLIALHVAAGALEPVVNSVESEYRVELPITAGTISLDAAVSPGASITVNGEAVVSGTPWQSPGLALGSTTIEIIVTAPERAPARYALQVQRGSGQFASLGAGTPHAGDRFGDRIAIYGSTLAVGAPGQDGPAADSGAVHVFERNVSSERSVSTWTQQAMLEAERAEASDQFGFALAAGPDTLVVSAPGTSDQRGAVHVFSRDGSGWSPQAYLAPETLLSGDGFGSSVALSNDTLVIGAPGADASSDNADSGAAYVFERHDGVWTFATRLEADGTPENARFGASIAISGNAIAVGSQGEAASDASGRESGAVYVFERGVEGFTRRARLASSNAEALDGFGVSVALEADTLVVGAYAEASAASGVDGDKADNSAFGAGAAYVFERAAEGWIERAYLKASNPGALDWFGASVKIANGAIVVGANGEDGSASGVSETSGDPMDDATTDSGAAYLFSRSGGSWAQSAYLKAGNPGSNYQFGSRIATSTDTLVVGAPAESGPDGAATSGAVYAFW
jgi:hypothetical protein